MTWSSILLKPASFNAAKSMVSEMEIVPLGELQSPPGLSEMYVRVHETSISFDSDRVVGLGIKYIPESYIRVQQVDWTEARGRSADKVDSRLGGATIGYTIAKSMGNAEVMGRGTRASGGDSERDGESSDETAYGVRRGRGGEEKRGESGGVEEESARTLGMYGSTGFARSRGRCPTAAGCAGVNGARTGQQRHLRGRFCTLCESGEGEGAEDREKDGIKMRRIVTSGYTVCCVLLKCFSERKGARKEVQVGRLETIRAAVCPKHPLAFAGACEMTE
ncbi:hypothetical protein B0H16DRAFT_1705865 [Mycena metata]|uniref:Uncharacterized protein n=1 Tax=Mycena metata TaxID=1033252 RepID=A0AAD7GNK9_9AGAR|nr:hypothetical protein B0H16DRAFT_1705865 [Mycena metata]